MKMKMPILILFLLFCTLGVSAQNIDHTKKHEMVSDSIQKSEYTKNYLKIMDKMHHDMSNVPVSGNDDIDFLRQMIPHHQGAIDMAKAILRSTKDKRVRNLALGIITEQQNEINIMNQIIKSLEQKTKNEK